jgi:NADPH:quinone reductase-like Zn-dependent oxidoreductase
MGGLKEGATLLAQRASTATGQASVDIGRSLGAKVYATSRPEKLDKVRALGAEPLAYGDLTVRELEANVVFDPIGADTFADSVEALAREGTLVTPGAVGNPMGVVQPLDAGGEACPHPGSRPRSGKPGDDGAP